MRYLPQRDHGYRIGNSASRTTVPVAVDDKKVIQEKTINGYSKESHARIEFFSNYGFTNVVQPPTGEGENAQTAEAITVYLGSNRSHGVIVANGDRRFRLYKLENGETAMHDDQGHQIVMHRDAIYVSAPNSKKIVLQIMQQDGMPQDDVETVRGHKLGQTKQKGRPVVASFVLDKDSLTVTHAKAINFNAPIIMNTVSDHFSTVGETRLGADDARHPVYGLNLDAGVGMTTKPHPHPTAVLVKTTEPGPPVSLDTAP